MTPSLPTYEADALQYGAGESRTSEIFFRHDLMEEPDRPQGMACYFWLLRGEGRTVLVDCGFDLERGRARDRHQSVSPTELLARLDIAPSEIDHLVVSHLHFDHVGNASVFPNAEVVLARPEYEFWAGPDGDQKLMRGQVIPSELDMVRRIESDGRPRLIEDTATVVPRIKITVHGGQTPGLSVVSARVAVGELVLASDAIHMYEQLQREWPFRLFTVLPASFRSFELLGEARNSRGLLVWRDTIHELPTTSRTPVRPVST